MASAVKSANDSAQSPAWSRKAWPAATWARAARSRRASPAKTSGGRPDSDLRAGLERGRVGPLRLLGGREVPPRARRPGGVHALQRGRNRAGIQSVRISRRPTRHLAAARRVFPSLSYAATMHPFRFAVQLTGAPDGKAWRDMARQIEELGYSTLFLPDHFGDQWGPLVGLTVAAEATTTLRVGSLVFDNDYRHPVVLAKEIATLDLVSEGRVEFGLGAGWMKSDYDEAGLPYDAPACGSIGWSKVCGS